MSAVVRASALCAVLTLCACHGGAASVSIGPEPPLSPAPEAQGEMVKAEAFPIEYAPLKFKVAIAVPDGGHLCIMVPESAQDPTACLGLEPSAMVEALPEGPERPFAVAKARIRDWSFLVMMVPNLTGYEVSAQEDVERYIADAAKPDVSDPTVVPRIVPLAPGKNYEIVRVRDVPVVKFRIDRPVAADNPLYEMSSTLNYAAFGEKEAVVSFVTSPKDVDALMPYADATIDSLVLPPREKAALFGKPRADLDHQGVRTALLILGPLAVLGSLLLVWLGRAKKAEPEAAEGAKSTPSKRGES